MATPRSCTPGDAATHLRDSVPGRRRPPLRSEIRTRAGSALPQGAALPAEGVDSASTRDRRGTVVQAFSCAVAAIYRPASDDRRASGPARQTPARDDKQTRRSSLLRLDSVRAVARAAGHVARVLMRAIPHVEGKAIRSSRRARRGAGCWLRRTIGAAGRTPMSSSRMTWRRASAARRPLIGRACPDRRRGGEGFARPHSGRSRDVRPRPPVCARGRGRRHAHGRRACVSSGAGVGSGQWRRGLIKGAAAQRPAARSSHCSDSSVAEASAMAGMTCARASTRQPGAGRSWRPRGGRDSSGAAVSAAPSGRSESSPER